MVNEPKTADGVEIVQGMKVWLLTSNRKKVVSRTVQYVGPKGCVFTTRSAYSINPRDLYADRAEAELKLDVGD